MFDSVRPFKVLRTRSERTNTIERVLNAFSYVRPLGTCSERSTTIERVLNARRTRSERATTIERVLNAGRTRFERVSNAFPYVRPFGTRSLTVRLDLGRILP